MSSYAKNVSEKNQRLANNRIIQCACGCGRTLRLYNDRGYRRVFVNGHHAKVQQPSKSLRARLINSASKMGSKNPMKRLEVKRKSSLSHKGKKWSKAQKETMRSIVTSPEYRKKMGRSIGKLWKRPEYVCKQMASRRRNMPNKLERKFSRLCKREGLPFEFVGGGKLVVAGKVPDFWDGRKSLIELYGDYWHRGEDPQPRIDFFKVNGYRCMVLWEKEFKNTRLVIRKVLDFMKGE